MSYIDALLHPKTNVEEMVGWVIRDLKIKVSKQNLFEKLKNHPHFPSLLAIRDVLESIGIDSCAVNIKNFQALPPEARNVLVQIKTEQGEELFAYVFGWTEERIEWFNPQKHKREFIKHDDFATLFTGYAMLFEALDNAGEKDYKSAYRKELQQRIVEYALILFVPVIAILSIAIHISENGIVFWQRYFYALLLFAGCLIGGLLLLHDYNEESPLLSNFCRRNEKTNCSAVLHSKGAQFLGVSWSVIGSSYFLGMLLSLSISCFNSNIFYTAAVLHGFTLPYVAYSLYYQKYKVKQWCTLCLSVLAVLLALFVLSVVSGAYCHIKEIKLTSLVFIFGISISAFTSLYFLWHLTRQIKANGFYKKALNQIKYDKDVFNLLLQKQTKITIPTDGYGIILGNPNGSIHIVEVYNPYCGHCANAQSELRKLLETNDDIKLQIMFAADPDSEYYDQMPIDTFLSLYEEKADVAVALSDWFDGKVKTTEELKQKYPVAHANTSKNKENAKAMNRFCEEMEITGTPTMFINGNQLPDNYRTGDLIFFY